MVLTAVIASLLDAHERFVRLTEQYERWELDELLVLAVTGLAIFGVLERRRLRNEIERARHLEEQLRAQALHDPLTALPNRSLVLDRLGQALARLDRRGGSVAVGFLDLDGFKSMNDDHGHSVGDELLIRTAARLGSAVRDEDTVGRIGGDEFVIVCHCETAAEAARLVERARLAVAHDDDRLHITASAGVAVAAQATSPSTLLDAADRAMYQAKAAGRDRTVGAQSDPSYAEAQLPTERHQTGFERVPIRPEGTLATR